MDVNYIENLIEQECKLTEKSLEWREGFLYAVSLVLQEMTADLAFEIEEKQREINEIKKGNTLLQRLTKTT